MSRETSYHLRLHFANYVDASQRLPIEYCQEDREKVQRELAESWRAAGAWARIRFALWVLRQYW